MGYLITMSGDKIQFSGEDAIFEADLERIETHACYSPLIDTEYYRLVLTHCDGHDSNIELPITAKAIVDPYSVQKLSRDGLEALIDELYRQLKECWMLTRRNGERDGSQRKES